jgi:hypothetical protein
MKRELTRRALLLGACLPLLFGCGGSLPAAADAKVGEEALRAALEGWKNGESAQTMQQRRPPIWFNDSGIKAGVKLLRYELISPVEPYGRQLRCTVSLVMQDPKGSNSYEKRIGYQIETNPHIVIAREGL